MKAWALVLAFLAVGCGGRTDLSETEALREFYLCVNYCTLNRSGSEGTACYQPVEECPEDCQGLTFHCVRELNRLVECQLKAGASLVCRGLNPWVDYLDDVCLEEWRLEQECICVALSLCWPPSP
jgi:hypothetical protein